MLQQQQGGHFASQHPMASSLLTFPPAHYLSHTEHLKEYLSLHCCSPCLAHISSDMFKEMSPCFSSFQALAWTSIKNSTSSLLILLYLLSFPSYNLSQSEKLYILSFFLILWIFLCRWIVRVFTFQHPILIAPGTLHSLHSQHQEHCRHTI